MFVCSCAPLHVTSSAGLQHPLLTVTLPPCKWPCFSHSLPPSNLFFPSLSPSILHSFPIPQPSIIPLSSLLSALDPPSLPKPDWMMPSDLDPDHQKRLHEYIIHHREQTTRHTHTSTLFKRVFSKATYQHLNVEKMFSVCVCGLH